MTKVVIDHDILGWSNENEDTLLKLYDSILRVSVDENLPRRSSDGNLGSFCKDNNCDFLTGDAKAYSFFYEDSRIENLQISKFDWYKKGDKPIYLVKILD